MKMKQWIDYLFWKRRWFRWLIIFPVWLVPLGIWLHHYISSPNTFVIILYLIIVDLALMDNDHVGSPRRPA